MSSRARLVCAEPRPRAPTRAAWQAVFDATGGSGWSARARAAAPRATRRLRSTVEGLRGKRGAREGVCVPRSSLRATQPRSARTVIIAIDPRARRPPSIVAKTHTPLVDAPRRPDSPLPFPSLPFPHPSKVRAERRQGRALRPVRVPAPHDLQRRRRPPARARPGQPRPLGRAARRARRPDAPDVPPGLQVSRRSPAPGGA